VLDPGRGKTKTGFAWAIARDDRPWGGTEPPAVVFHYAPGRGAEHARDLLAGYTGILQCDGYAGYKGLGATLVYCWAHTIRTQSTSVGALGLMAGRLASKWNDMLDLQCIVVDDDALDDQPEYGLAFARTGRVQPGTDALAEGGEAGQGLTCLQPLIAQPKQPFMLLLGQMALLGEGPPLARQFIQADHLGLVGLEQALVGPVQTVEAGTQPDAGRVLGASSLSLGEEALELRPELRGIAEQARDMRPDRLFEWLRLDACPRAFRLAGRRERVGSGAAVVAPADPPAVSGKVAAVDAEAASAALEQAAQHVVVLFVPAERKQRVTRQRGGHPVRGPLIDQRRRRYRNPLLGRTRPPGGALGAAA
jgi:hypothetical protein